MILPLILSTIIVTGPQTIQARPEVPIAKYYVCRSIPILGNKTLYITDVFSDARWSPEIANELSRAQNNVNKFTCVLQLSRSQAETVLNDIVIDFSEKNFKIIQLDRKYWGERKALP